MFDSPDLTELNTGFVFVGLNRSGTPKDGDAGKEPDDPWFNFHAGRNDYKLRYALRGTRYWESYITDVIKNIQETDAGEVNNKIEKHPELLEENLKRLREELGLPGGRPVLVALGHDAEEKLGPMGSEGYEVVRILHPATHCISNEEYRDRVLEVLDDIRR